MKCNRCNGTGFEVVDEDNGERVETACYHCGNTGEISEAQDRADRVESLVALIASDKVERLERACENDPEGENFAFAAAENMCSLHEYRMSRKVDAMVRIGAEIAKLPDWMVDDLIELLMPTPPEPKEAPKEYEDLPYAKQIANEYPEPPDLGDEPIIPF